MTDRLPDRQEREPLDTLHTIRNIQPDAQSAHRAVQRAVAAVEGRSWRRRRIGWKGIIMRGSLAAAILIIVGGTAWIAVSGSNAIAAPTWNDMLKQTSGIDRVYIDAWGNQGANAQQHMEIWIKSPGLLRARSYELIDGKMAPAECTIATPTTVVRWHERTKLGEHAPAGNRYMMQSGVASTFEAMLGISLVAHQAQPNIKINDELATFVPVQDKHPQDATLRGFRLKNRNPSGPELVQPFTSLVYWFAERSNTLCRLTMTMGEGDQAQRSDMIVRFDPDLPADWFDLKLPAGIADVAAGVAPRLSPDVRAVYDKVVAARKRFGDYRAVIWRDGTGGWPVFREAAVGEQWRCDTIDWTDMAVAMKGKNTQQYIRISPADPFGRLWAQVNRADYTLTLSAMTRRGKLAFVNYGARAAQCFAVMSSGYENFFAPSFRMTAWPEWMWWENLQDQGWNLGSQPFHWRLGPIDPQHRERVSVIGERGPKHFYTVVRYVFDSSRDWVCVHQEWEINPSDKKIWDVTECAQTADGLWYPRRGKILGTLYEYAVERATAEQSFFDYPKGLPEPTNPFDDMMSQLDQATAAAQAKSAPPTAKGKYTAFSSRGLPRGFDDKARMEVHSEMVQKMTHISRMFIDYAHDHRWEFPVRLQAMVDEGYLKPEDLQNPLHPDADPPFGYIPPLRDVPNPDQRMVLYEPFKEWPGVIAVVFQDHSVEYIHDKAQFDKLLQEATRVNPSSRPAGSGPTR